MIRTFGSVQACTRVGEMKSSFFPHKIYLLNLTTILEDINNNINITADTYIALSNFLNILLVQIHLSFTTTL